jgi:arsenite methyltransferase
LSPWSGSVERSPVRFSRSSKSRDRVHIPQAPSKRAARLLRILPNTGVHLFGEDELGDILEDHGFIGVRTKSLGTIQWVRAKRG